MAEPLKWYDEKADNSPWIEALAELRQRATREEGHCYQHVQAITVAIDQYAEKALGQPRLLSQQTLRCRLARAPFCPRITLSLNKPFRWVTRVVWPGACRPELSRVGPPGTFP